MAQEREVLIKIKAVDGGSAKTINLISTALKNLQREIAKPISDSSDKSASYKTASYNAAIKDIDKLRKENLRAEKAIAAEITRSDTISANNKVKEAKRAANGVISSLREIQKESAKSASGTAGVFGASLGGSFFGNLGANAVSSFISKLSALPSQAAAIIESAVKLSSEKINALKGLESIANFKGIDKASAQSAVENFRLVKAGIVDVAEATTALKNLLATGFSLPESVKLFEAFSDSAAFGKQSALDFGQAIRGATEGLKNGQSQLVDNAGVTKNLSVILEEMGKSQKDVMNITSDASVRQAVYNGLLKETQGQVGDADKLTQGYTGTVSALDQAYINLQRSLGDVLTTNPKLIESNKILAEQINDYTNNINNANSETTQFATDATNAYARIKAQGLNATASLINGFQTLGKATILGVSSVGLGMVAIIETALATVRFLANKIQQTFADAVNFVIDNSKFGGAVGGLLAGAQRLERPADLTATDVFAGSSQILEDMRKLAKSLEGSYNKGVQLEKEFGQIGDRIQKANRAPNLASIKGDLNSSSNIAALKGDTNASKYRIVNNARGTPTLELILPEGAKINPVSPGSGEKLKKGGRTSGGRSSKNVFEEIKDIGRAQGFIPGSAQRDSGPNGPTDHKSRGAVDFGFNTNSRKTLEDWTRLIIAGLEKGKQVIDERVVGYHPGIKGGKNVHLGNSENRSLFLPQKFYSVPVGFLKELDAKRRSKRPGVVGNDEIERFQANQSDEKTKAERDKQIQSVIANYKAAGLIPTPELLGDIQSLMADEARKAGTAQPTKETVAKIFQANRDRLNPSQEQVGGRVPIATEFFDTRGAREYKAVIDELNDAVFQAAAGSEFYKTQKILESEATRNLTDDERANALAKANAIDAANVRRGLDEQLESARAASGGFSVYDETLKTLTTTYQNLTQAAKDNLLVTANTIDATNVRNGLDQQFEAALRGERAVTVYEETLKSLTTTYKNLSEAEKSELLVKASSIDAVKSAQENYAKLRDVVGESVQAFADGGFKGLFESIKQRFKQFLVDLATEFITSRFAKLFGGGGGSSIGAQQSGGGLFGGFQNLLGGLLGGGSGGSSSSGASAGGGISGIISNLFGGGGSSGSTNIGGINTPTNLIRGSIGGGGSGIGISGGGGNPLSGILSPQGISGALATGGAAIAVQLLIASIQAKTPLQGLATGSLLGLGFGFLNRSKLRKKEEKLRTEYLQASFQGLEGYDRLINDVRTLRIDSGSAITQGESLGSTIRAQYLSQANALTDKKTKGIALKDVSRIDTIIAEKMAALRKAADVANSAKLRADRIIPEFATGGYFADYFKPNGLLPGRFDGRDDILAKISRGEMVLNPNQIQSVIARAGHDVFAGVVPNYPKAQSGQGFMGGGRITGTQAATVIKVELHNVNTTPDSRMVLHTDDGKRQVVDIVRDARKNREL